MSISVSVPGWWRNLPRGRGCGVQYKIRGCQVVPRSGAEDSKLRAERMGRKDVAPLTVSHVRNGVLRSETLRWSIFRRLPASREDWR